MIFLIKRRCEAVFILFAYVFNFTFSFHISIDLKIKNNFCKFANVA